MNGLNLKASVLAIGLMFGALNANATTTTLTYDADGVAAFGNSFTTAGSFSDVYNFVVGSGYEATLSFSNSYTLFKKIMKSGTDITNAVLSSGTVTSGSLGLGSTIIEVWGTASPLSAGSYSLTIEGDTTSVAGNGYSGLVALSPVPEAETYSLMLVGLGFMGFVARRRRAD